MIKSGPVVNISNVLLRIQASCDRRSLLATYENAVRFPNISDQEREVVIEAIELRMREVAPTDATKIFGPKDTVARSFLQRVFDEIAEVVDVSQNEVKNGVKIGGEMIAGRRHVDIYISFKTVEKWNVGLEWLQDRPDQDPYLRMRKYQFSIKNVDTLLEQRFLISQADTAAMRFREVLLTILP